MSELLLRHGEWDVIDPKSASWQYLSFRVERLRGDDHVSRNTGGEEVALVPLGGRCAVESDGLRWELGGRASVFEGMPWALYLPRDTEYMLSAGEDVEVAAAGAVVETRLEPRLVRGGAHVFFGVAREQHQRGAVVARESAHRLPRRFPRALEVIAVAHARRLIEQEDHFAGAAARRHRAGIAPEERPREGEDDQDQGRGAQQQQRPVANAAAPHRLIGNAAHEHQRRELDHALALALNQMDQDRDGEGAERDEERGSQKCHRTRLSRSRLDR